MVKASLLLIDFSVSDEKAVLTGTQGDRYAQWYYRVYPRFALPQRLMAM